MIPNLRRRFEEGSWAVQEELDPYRALRECPVCHGNRLRPESLVVTLKGKTIADCVNLPISEALELFDTLELQDREVLIASRILKEIRDRLRFLNDVGVGYLTLARSAATLSGGEGQRIRLATQIGSNLTGVLYVLDEPSIGLHQRDNRKLLNTLGRLRDLGNTVIVVEHDEETIRTADYVVDLGPGAGEHGGQVIFQGTPGDLIGNGQRPWLTDRRLSRRTELHRRARGPPQGIQGRDRDQGCARQQPQGPRREDPARTAGGRHRRQRIGQEHAGQRHSLQGAGARVLSRRRRARRARPRSRASR